MVLEFLTSRALERTMAPVKSYYYLSEANGEAGKTCPLNVLTDWCYEVEIDIYYHAGILYFKNKQDLMAFQLRWC